MIYFLEKADDALEKACGLFPASGTQIYGYAARYGGMFPFCTSWIIQDGEGQAVGALGRIHSTLRLSCGTLSEELFLELIDFLDVIQWDTLEGPAETVQKIAQSSNFSGCSVEFGKTMEHRRGLSLCPVSDSIPIQENPSLQEIFHILLKGSSEFSCVNEMEWRRDASHLIRHDGGVYVLAEGKAVAGVTAVAPEWGLISQVVTHPEARGKGLATALISWCVNWLDGKGKGAVLLCSNTQAEKIYRRLGFEEKREFGILHRLDPGNINTV